MIFTADEARQLAIDMLRQADHAAEIQNGEMS